MAHYLIYAHAILMTLACFFFLCGFCLVRFFRRKVWWFKFHRACGLSGAVSVIIGFIMVYLSVSMSGGSHFAIPHAYAGAGALCLSVVTPVFGNMQFTRRQSAGRFKMLHVWSGRITIVLMIVNGIAGLFLSGII